MRGGQILTVVKTLEASSGHSQRADRTSLASNQRQRIGWKASSPFFFRQESHALFLFGFENMEVGVEGGTDRVRPGSGPIHAAHRTKGTDAFISNGVSEGAIVYKLGDYRY